MNVVVNNIDTWIAPESEFRVTDTISRFRYGHKKKIDNPQRPTMEERIS